MGIKTQLRDYGIAEPEIDQIVTGLQEHGMTALGEYGVIAPEDARRLKLSK